jgi:DNA-binding LacI/PurR family transcriptional regulator
MHRIGIIAPSTENDPETRARLLAFRQAMAQLGWEEVRNVRFDYR